MPAKFIKSAGLPREFPPDRGIEIAIAGRSNAGKSSLINLITNHRIAKVSNTPGKTRLLNFFEINKKYVLVDMPGYGWSARTQEEMIDWRKMIEAYLTGRNALRGLLLVMDLRRDWSADEQMLMQFATSVGLGFAIVATKTDKMNRTELEKAKRKLSKDSGISDIFLTSSLKKQGHLELEDWVYRNWVMPAMEELKIEAEALADIERAKTIARAEAKAATTATVAAAASKSDDLDSEDDFADEAGADSDESDLESES